MNGQWTRGATGACFAEKTAAELLAVLDRACVSPDPPIATLRARASAPLDWHQALQVAAARLGEQYILPDTAKHPLLADQVQWLAALICAYGKLTEEVDRMQARAAQPPNSKARG